MSESIFVNKKFYFSGKKLAKQIRPKTRTFGFSHGTCDCGRVGVDLAIVDLRDPIKLEFHNGKIKEGTHFALGSECVFLLECLK